MRKRINRRKNRYGASSVFLGIVLSAVILIECTFLTFVWELDYGIKVNNAVDAQIESIMCEYNRQLFDVYGIYAFIRREFPAYMFRQTMFAFFDFAEPLLFFLLDYLAIMVLFATLGHGVGRLVKQLSKQKNSL